MLQRKTEEAAMATKRLKELLEAKKASSRELANGPGIQVVARLHLFDTVTFFHFFFTLYFLILKALMHIVEHELEVTVRVHEVRSQYERQMQE